MVGENFVLLVGKITYPKFKELEGGGYMFKAKLAIPVPENNGTYQYIKIGAWGDKAEALGELRSGTYIRMHGHIEESSYDSECRYCQGPEKKYWTEIVVDNFIMVSGD